MPTTRIHCTTTFLDGRDRFEAGDVRSVETERAERFISAGWATLAGQEPAASAGPAAEPVSLSIQSTRQAQEASHG